MTLEYSVQPIAELRLDVRKILGWGPLTNPNIGYAVQKCVVQHSVHRVFEAFVFSEHAAAMLG